MRLKELLTEENFENFRLSINQVDHGKIITKIQNCDDFLCNRLGLTTLENCPSIIEGNFDCSFNELSSFEFCPKIIGNVVICYDNKITSLDQAPIKIGSYFSCSRNQISSLDGIGKKYLTSMQGDFHITSNPLKSHVLGLLLIKGITGFHFLSKVNDVVNLIDEDTCMSVESIVDTHIRSKDRDILECREELVQAGLKEYAKL